MFNPKSGNNKASERASFVNLLSQYLKEKRNLGDISAVGMASKPESKVTMNFLPNMDNSSEPSKPTSNVKSSDFFPEIGSTFGASSFKEDVSNYRTDFRKQEIVEPKNAAQLTMFFKGQVLVYNDFPADKFTEIIALASQGCSVASIGDGGGVAAASDSGVEKVSSAKDKIDINASDIPDLNIASITANTPAQDSSVDCRQYGGSDLRIARRNSLHKFFAKRKDRAAARAPYQVGSPPPPKPDEMKSSNEELGQSSRAASRDLDLNL